MTTLSWLAKSLRARHAGRYQKATGSGAFETFGIRSADGGVVRARAFDGLLINDSAELSGDARDLVLFRLRSIPHFGFVVADGETPIELGMQGDLLRAPVLSYRLRRHGDAETAVLRDPLVDHYACAIPGSYGTSLPLQLNRTDVGGWEVFRLVARRCPELPSATNAALLSIETVFSAGFGPDAVLDWLSAAPVDWIAILGQSLLRLAPPDTIVTVAAGLLEHPDLAAKLSSALPSESWSGPALHGVARWAKARSRRNIIHVGPELDGLATVVQQGRASPDPMLHLLAAVRRHVEPTNGLAAVATARNEGPYIVNWIAYHRAMGVEHFFIYSNDNDDDSDGLLFALAHAGIITCLPNRVESTVSIQNKAYNHAFLCVPEILDYRWIAVIDLDEYIVVDPGSSSSLAAFLQLQEARGGDAVALNWRGFGSDGQATFSDRPLIERIVGREARLNPHVKTITRSNRVWGSAPHMSIWPDRVSGLALDSCGEPHFSPGRLGGAGAHRNREDAGPAWINHYYSKSFPECVWKFARNSVQSAAAHEPRFNNVFIPGFLYDFDGHNQVQDRTILAYADETARERARLMAIPGVAAAHARTVDVFCKRVGALVSDIPAHADQVPETVRAAYLDLVARSVAEGVATC